MRICLARRESFDERNTHVMKANIDLLGKMNEIKSIKPVNNQLELQLGPGSKGNGHSFWLRLEIKAPSVQEKNDILVWYN